MKKNKNSDEKKKNHHAKRKVNNKNSENMPHIKNAFYSNKTQEIINFESFRENVIGKIAELSTIVEKYYAQSEEVSVMVYDSNGELKPWPHVPDLLVYCQGLIPCLYQIKAEESKPEKNPAKKMENINRACQHYVRDKGWEYKVIYPFELDAILRNNIELLFSYRNNANYTVSNTIKSLLGATGEMSIDSLLSLCESEADGNIVPAAIYYEIAVGNLYVDLLEPIMHNSMVRLKQESDYDLYDYVLELHDYSKQSGRIQCCES